MAFLLCVTSPDTNIHYKYMCAYCSHKFRRDHMYTHGDPSYPPPTRVKHVSHCALCICHTQTQFYGGVSHCCGERLSKLPRLHADSYFMVNIRETWRSPWFRFALRSHKDSAVLELTVVLGLWRTNTICSVSAPFHTKKGKELSDELTYIWF